MPSSPSTARNAAQLSVSRPTGVRPDSPAIAQVNPPWSIALPPPIERPSRSTSVLRLRASTPLRRRTPSGRGSANLVNASASVYASGGAPRRSRNASRAGWSSSVYTRPLPLLVTIIGSPILRQPCGNWWFSGGDSSVDRKLTIGRFLANAGSSMKSLMAETAMVNGDFPSQQRSFNSFFNSWVSPIWNALDKTQGGGYMYGGLKGGSFGNGAYGFTTVKQVDGDLLKVDPSEQYIHVVDPPTNGTVRVRDNGYVVSSVPNLRTGAAV